MEEMRRAAAFAAILLNAAAAASAQQRADMDFRPHVVIAAYPVGHGPVVLIDEAHHNFHTAAGRYAPFARLIAADGYRVRTNQRPFTAVGLKDAKVLVIANALNERNDNAKPECRQPPGCWVLPTPSAFTAEEIAAVKAWIEGGGSILLIADHMPFGGAAHDLAVALGFGFNNAYALDPSQQRPGIIEFRRADSTLRSHAIIAGRGAAERIDSIASFTGEAFQQEAGVEAIPLMVLRTTVVSLKPETAGQLGPDVPREAVGGWWQGAVRKLGKGRVAAFGEAAMFSAQISNNGGTMGMNAPVAAQNAQFALNVMRWLSGLLEPAAR